MNRKAIWTLVCGAVALCSTFTAIKVSLSNDGRANEDGELDDPITVRRKDVHLGKPGVPFNQGVQNPAVRQQSATRQQQFVNLSNKKAQRMSDEELGEAVQQLTKELADQDAAAEAEFGKAVEQLKEIAAKFPGTPSAERASRALQAIETVKINPKQKDRTLPSDLEDSDEDIFSRKP